jgi:low temperature requirement protein LtrA
VGRRAQRTSLAQLPDADDRVERVTTLELFFDLVLVFAITQLTTVLFHEPTATVVSPLVQLVLLVAAFGALFSVERRAP